MDVTASAHAAALWAGLLILLMLVLSLLVVRQRAKHEVMLGDDGVPELARASRAFGNAAEYAPAGIAALAVLTLVQAPPLVLHIVGATLFVGRVAHAIGLSLTGGPSPGRIVGMIATWLAFIFAGVALLFYAIG
ncbi:MAG TPA: MAPEG family protein [Caulobacteraceae bacterium]|jgi:uncharacterized protein